MVSVSCEVYQPISANSLSFSYQLFDFTSLETCAHPHNPWASQETVVSTKSADILFISHHLGNTFVLHHLNR